MTRACTLYCDFTGDRPVYTYADPGGVPLVVQRDIKPANDSPRRPVREAIGLLVCREALDFVDGVLEPGTRVEQVKPTELERKGSGKFVGGLVEDERNDLDKRDPTEWIVVEWREKRRRVPRRAFQ